MNRDTADRIIVKSNARMKLVIDWYYENKHWLDREGFLAPMESGVVELQEEQIEFTFENKNGGVEIAVFSMEKPFLPAVITFQYDPKTQEISEHRFADHLSEERKVALEFVLGFDRTDWKEATKYHALMLFMAYYREEVKIEQRVERRPAKHKKKKRSAQLRQPLIRRVYTVEEFDRASLPKPEQAKRGYTKPDHEVSVRGHLRRYKSGKVVWIQPSVRYKGRAAHHKEYEL